MLRHFKMELKRQQERENRELASRQDQGNLLLLAAEQGQQTPRPLATTDSQAIDLKRRKQEGELGHAAKQTPKRVRGRRSSKPAMEKRRRARINECLEILRSYVLNDTGNLNRLGIDLSLGENLQLDEDSIARQILKSSGLINRHRGRKNPNKLEKADILELTVDYVRRLHEQRDELLVTAVLAPQIQQQHCQPTVQRQPMTNTFDERQVIPAHLNEPLTLDLSPKSRLCGTQSAAHMGSTPPTLQAAAAAAPYRPPPNTPLTPPSSASSMQSESATDMRNHHHRAANQNQVSQMQLLSQVLSDGRYGKVYNYANMSVDSAQQ